MARGTAGRVRYRKMRARDWEALLRLSHDATAFAAGTVERRRFVSDCFCRLVGSIGTNLFELDFDRHVSGMPPKSSVECHGHIAGTEALIEPYLRGLYATDPVPMAFFESGQLVVQDADMVSRRSWEASDAYQRVRKPAGVDHQIYAMLDCGPRRFGLAVHRGPGERAFSPRELELATAFATIAQYSWGLHAALLPGQAKPSARDARLHGLPPRFVGVLEHLLRGDSAKQIAFASGLSVHTVYEYTKQIYRRFNVSGRGELLSLFVKPTGDGPPALPN
jgi:DNA-binding CsgD family transcriptional regulator